MSSGPPENGAFVWGTDEGQGGDCVGGPEVPHRLAPPEPAPDSPLSCSESSLCPKGPAPDLVRESSVCPKAARDEKVERRMCSQEKNSGIPPPLSQRTGGRRKKTEAAFTIFTSNKTSQGTILIAQSGPWVCEAFPKMEWTRRIRTRRAPIFPKGSLGLL